PAAQVLPHHPARPRRSFRTTPPVGRRLRRAAQRLDLTRRGRSRSPPGAGLTAMQAAWDASIEAQIREWRSYLLRRPIAPSDVDELEDHLRNEMTDLGAAGLSGDESLLVALKRIGAVHELSR